MFTSLDSVKQTKRDSNEGYVSHLLVVALEVVGRFSLARLDGEARTRGGGQPRGVVLATFSDVLDLAAGQEYTLARGYDVSFMYDC